ncbi:MAG: thiosulfate oxidation carrier protein SoxY [Gammaproteobacteria bacterium]|jgi:sulfur-oxidizing protein SoxY|nr:thiosulfate oxidation carrier protein SoxY [Gammaproteobacteria bacterium]MBT7047565.1 thiosulfate oxidation carrier protein SoxY [Gammaproteobacteria bacterium]
MNRRTLLKRTLAVSAVSVAASAGLLAPGQALAAYPTAAFEAKDSAAALSAALGSGSFEHSDDIKIKAPDIAENGSVVPVTISSTLAGVESISLLSESNNSPMVASFNLNGSQAFVSTRIKMGKTGNVLAVVKSGGKLYANRKEVKVTIGGCGG